MIFISSKSSISTRLMILPSLCSYIQTNACTKLNEKRYNLERKELMLFILQPQLNQKNFTKESFEDAFANTKISINQNDSSLLFSMLLSQMIRGVCHVASSKSKIAQKKLDKMQKLQIREITGLCTHTIFLSIFQASQKSMRRIDLKIIHFVP